MRSAANPTQAEKAYDALKRAIVRGEIPEGSFLSEPEIMARHRIGRTPYREACNRLHHEGLLQVVPRRGYFVPEISFQTVRELFEARLILEDAIAELASSRANEQEIAELDRLAKQTPRSARAKEDPGALIQANTRFHLQLARMSRNGQLVDMLTRNLESTERLMYLELRSSGFRPEEFRMLHGQIVAALRMRDADAARQAVWQDISQAQSSTLTPARKLRKKSAAGKPQ